MERQRASGGTLHDRIVALLERSSRAHEHSRRLIEQHGAVHAGLRETLDAVRDRRRATVTPAAAPPARCPPAAGGGSAGPTEGPSARP